MINKDKIFRQIVKDLHNETSNLKNLPLSSVDLFNLTLSPLIKMVSNKYIKDINIYYSFYLDKITYTKFNDKLDLSITFSIKAATDIYFKDYNFIISFVDISNKYIKN